MSQKGPDAGKQGGARRLGRGLSSLIGPAPVRVDVPPETPILDSDRQYADIIIHNNDVSDSDAGGGGGGAGGAGGREGVAAGGGAMDTGAGGAGVVARERDEGGVGGVDSERVLMVAVGEIVPSRFQPRQVFDEVKLRELAESIRSIGLMQPVIVRGAVNAEGRGGPRRGEDRGRGVVGDGGESTALESGATRSQAARYELVAGERRWRAAAMAGLERVPVIVRELDDEACATWGLVENLQREDLDPIEKGEACRVMIERFGMTPQGLSERLGVDRSTIVNMVRLTELEESIQRLVRAGDLTMGHARSLLSVPRESGARLALATLVSIEGWSVRKLEQEVKRVAKGKPVAAGRGAAAGVGGVGGAERSASIADLEKRLGEHLGTRVKIKTDKSGKRGRIEVAFFDLDHFDGLMQRVGFSHGK